MPPMTRSPLLSTLPESQRRSTNWHGPCLTQNQVESKASKRKKFHTMEVVMNKAMEQEKIMWLGFGVFTAAMAFGSAVFTILSVAIVP